jgi:ATP-dependent RNA helicase RhlE
LAFSALNLHPALLRAISDLGFVRPTGIQGEAIPPALAGRDILGCAQTGSGKTASFLLPIINKLVDQPRGVTRALVLVPTRELAAQVLEDFRDLARHTNVRAAAVFGGVSPAPQEQAFRNGVDIIIATPGRLLEHLRAPYAKLDRLEMLVLDEADRMLDMGFLPEIRKVLRFLPSARQTLFFSATMPAEIRQLTGEMLRTPVTIERERPSTTPTGIKQVVYPVSQDLKPALLIELIRRGEIKQALVFTRTKHRANRLAELLVKGGIKAGKIHGNRSQGQRTLALDDFKNGQSPILVATDIVARGIDVEALEHVVNFDVPVVAEDYIHRIGRTGRAEATGEAYTLASPEERGDLAAIERALGRPLPRATLADFNYTARAAEPLEIPLAQRIAEIRRRKAEDRARADAKRQRREGALVGAGAGSGQGRRPGRFASASGSGRPQGGSHRGPRRGPSSGGGRFGGR